MTVNPVPLSRASSFSQVVMALDQSGVSPERLTRRLNLPNWHNSIPDRFVPMEHGYRLVHFGAKAAGDPFFGARVMEQVGIHHRGVLFRQIRKEPNLYLALQAVVRAVKLYGTSRLWWLAEDHDDVWLFRGGPLVFGHGEAEMEQLALVGLVQVVRMAAGANWKPMKVRVQVPENVGLAKLAIFDGAAMCFDPNGCAIAIPRSILNCGLQGNTARCPSNEGGFDREGLSIEPPSDFAGSLRQLVATLLLVQPPRIEVLAEIVGLHVRTLQRRLEKDGLTFNQLVDDVRHRQAVELLQQLDARVTDIAFDLGYSDAAHFTRACRRWTGLTPSQYRRVHRIPQTQDPRKCIGV